MYDKTGKMMTQNSLKMRKENKKKSIYHTKNSTAHIA